MKPGPSFRRHASMIAEPSRGAVLISIVLIALIMVFNSLSASSTIH